MSEKEKKVIMTAINRREIQNLTEMYAEDLITKEELRANVDGLLEQQKQIENQLKIIAFDFNRGKDIRRIMEQTFQTLKISVRDMTNTQLKQIIDRIEVDKDGNVDIYFRLLEEFGFDKSVLIYDDRT